MELGTSESAYPGSGDWQIPVDLFGSKKHAGVPRGHLAFADASGNIVFRVNHQPPIPIPDPHSPPPKNIKLLLDASGNPLFSICRYDVDNNGDKELVFRVQRTLKTLTRVGLEIFLDGEDSKDSTCYLKVRGSPFQRSCSIYKDTALVAQYFALESALHSSGSKIDYDVYFEQTSLMYKLHQLRVSRGKFRLTIFPGTIDHAFIVALFVIFLNGRK